MSAEMATVCLATQLTEGHDLSDVLALDARLDAMPWMLARRQESRRLGHQALHLSNTLVDSLLLLAFSVRVEAGTTPGHHPVVFGMASAQFGWSAAVAAQAYVQASVASLVSASLGRVPLDAADGESVLWAIGDELPRLARAAAEGQFRRTSSSVLSSPSCVGSAKASTAESSRAEAASAAS